MANSESVAVQGNRGVTGHKEAITMSDKTPGGSHGPAGRFSRFGSRPLTGHRPVAIDQIRRD